MLPPTSHSVSATAATAASCGGCGSGLALEIGTSIWPSQFLLLASAGTLTRAVGKGMGKPVFRVVQNHFAAAGNVGAVAAKEEVWEVSAQLVGYAASVLLLEMLKGVGEGGEGEQRGMHKGGSIGERGVGE